MLAFGAARPIISVARSVPGSRLGLHDAEEAVQALIAEPFFLGQIEQRQCAVGTCQRQLLAPRQSNRFVEPLSRLGDRCLVFLEGIVDRKEGCKLLMTCSGIAAV